MASSELRAEGQVDSWSSETVIALIARGRWFKKESFLGRVLRALLKADLSM